MPTPTPEPKFDPGYKWVALDEGQIVLEEEFIGEFRLMDDIRNFLAATEFEVPRLSRMGLWDFGYMFRGGDPGDFSVIRVVSDGRFVLSVVKDNEWEIIESGFVPQLNTRTGEKNSLVLYVIEDRAWLSVNQVLITDFDISDSRSNGTVNLASGIARDTHVVGRQIRFSNVNAYEIIKLHESEDGVLERTSETTQIQGINAWVNVSVGYAEAVFHLPSPLSSWSVGIGFRRNRGNNYESDYLLFAISHDRRWDVVHATWSGDGWQTLNNGLSNAVDTTAPVSNHLEVFFTGSVAYVYVNGEPIGSADIGSVLGTGDIAVMFGIYRDNDQGVAQVEDFGIWGLPGF